MGPPCVNAPMPWTRFTHCAPTTASSEDAQTASMWAWAQEQGVTAAPGVTWSLTANAAAGRGLVATEALPVQSVVLSVPSHLLLTPAAARRDPVLAKCAGVATVADAALLSCWLLSLVARGRESPFWTYICSLPTSYTDGGGWSDANVEELQAPYAVAHVAELVTQRQADLHCAAPLLDALQLPVKLRTAAAWSWAASTVSSRTVYAGPDGGSCGALCPCGDLVNHSVSADGLPTGRGELRGDLFCFIIEVAVNAGDECTVSYSTEHSSLDLLALYGFLGSPTPADVALLPRGPHLDGILPHEPASALFVSMIDGAPGWTLLTALRLAHASPAVRKARGHAAAAGEMLDVESEAGAYTRLGTAAAAALAALPTTEAQDVARLAQGSGSMHPHLALAVQWRIRYKRALRLCVDLCAARTRWCLSQTGPRLVSAGRRM